VNSEEVLESKLYLRRIREWPDAERVNPKRWLDAFAPEHSKYAAALLDAFIFISEKQVKKLFASTVHGLSAEITKLAGSYAAKRSLWQQFLASVLITAPTGEIPNPTDSGHIFLRMARTDLGIPEKRIVHASEIRQMVEQSPQAPLIVIDDFAGSGDQFITTWTRNSWPSNPTSLEQLSTMYSLDVYYLPLIATERAVERISVEAPSVKIRPSHVLTNVYNASDPDTVVFPDDLRAGAASFIAEASSRAGIYDFVNGFDDLGLAVAFEHSIPDACVGLLWSDEGGWQPLMAKT